MNGWGQQPGYGMSNGNYTYDTAMPAAPPVQSVGGGFAEIARALINGYGGYLDQQQRTAPMQLPGAQQQPNFLQALFSSSPPGNGGPSVPDPASAGIY